MDLNRKVNIIAANLKLPVNTPPFTLCSFAIFGPLGDLVAYGNSSNALVLPNGVSALTATGTTTIGGVMVVSQQALSGAGAVDIVSDTTKFTSTGSAQALTLADGAPGQIKRVIHVVDGGSGVLTPATKTGFSTITFTNAGDSATLEFVATLGWFCLGVNGATLA